MPRTTDLGDTLAASVLDGPRERYEAFFRPGALDKGASRSARCHRCVELPCQELEPSRGTVDFAHPSFAFNVCADKDEPRGTRLYLDKEPLGTCSVEVTVDERPIPDGVAGRLG